MACRSGSHRFFINGLATIALSLGLAGAARFGRLVSKKAPQRETVREICRLTSSPHLFQLWQRLFCLTLILVLAAAFGDPCASAQTFSLFYQFKAGRDGSQPYANVIVDGKGNLYGTTTIDGVYGYGTVFKITSAGKEIVLHSFTGTNGDGANPTTPLFRDAAGNLYGTTSAGGLYGGACASGGCGTVFRIDSTGKETILYRFAGNPTDGQIPEQGLVRDQAGNLYGTTFQGGTVFGGIVFKIDSAGNETVLHNFSGSSGDGYFPFGGSLLLDSAGNLYGTTFFGGSLGAGTVYKLDSSGNVTVLYNYGFSGGSPYEPSGTLTLGPAGSLYGATYYGGSFNFGTIFKLQQSGAEKVLHSFSAADGDGAIPGGGLVLDSAGNLYGTTNSGGDLYYGTVFKLDPGGTETVLHSFSGTDGRLPELGLVRDSSGNLYGTTQYGGAYGGGVVFKITP